MGPYHHHLVCSPLLGSLMFEFLIRTMVESFLREIWSNLTKAILFLTADINLGRGSSPASVFTAKEKEKMFCIEGREASHCYALTIAPPRPSQREGNRVLGLLLDFLGGGNLGLFRCVWESDSLEGSHFDLLLVGGVSELDSPEGMDRDLPRQTVRAPG